MTRDTETLKTTKELFQWYSLAVEQGHAYAIKLSDPLEKRMTPSQITEAKRLARIWSENRKKR